MVEKDGGTGMNHQNCPVCRSQDTFVFLKRDRIPIVQNVIFPDRGSAVSVPRGDLHLSCCRSCGFIFNRAFDKKQTIYGNAYDNRQHFSEYFTDYMKEISECLIHKKGVIHSRIVEVGCGDGTFLRLLLSDEQNGNTGIGFDPSYRGPESDCGGRARFVVDYYDQRYAGHGADVVISRHVIEHIIDPMDFLMNIRSSLDKQGDATIFLETPDVRWILENNTFWDFCYEHCSYFSPGSLSAALRIAGFEPVELIATFRGQYMLSVAKPTGDGFGAQVWSEPDEVPELAEEYARHEQDFVQKSRSLLRNASRTSTVSLWGAGAKGVMYANMIDPDAEFISSIVDVNPDKQGGFIPGSGHMVISPDQLAQNGLIIIMNENYIEEIKMRISSTGKAIRLCSVHDIGRQSS
jgi:SAM-dependent methyltransferase